MPINLIKRYPELLEILHLNNFQRNESLRSIFNRDIENNENFNFRNKKIYPMKENGRIDMDRQFMHLTCEEMQEKDEEGKLLPPKRIFEKDRSQRLHWIKVLIEELITDNIIVFSVVERDKENRKDVTRTYIYDYREKYVIILECQRNYSTYYLLTAYYFNRDYAEKEIRKKMQKKLPDVL